VLSAERAGRTRLPLVDDARDIDRATRPRLLVWELTLACDLACRHCGSRAAHARPGELTMVEALAAIESMYASGVREVSLIGGEAYLHEGWLEIIAALVGRGIEVGLTTGGRGFDRERAKAAAAAGLRAVTVSIDGDEAVHDRLRGVRGAYQRAVEAMSAIAETGMQLSVATQINRLSWPTLADVVDRVLEHRCTAWKFMLTVPMGRAADEPEVLLEPYELIALFPDLVAQVERCEQGGVAAWPGSNIGYFGPYEHVIRARFPGKIRGACGAGRGVLGLEADGGVKGCPSLPSGRWVGGSLRDASLDDIVQRAAPLRAVRDRTVDDLSGFCRTCYYASVCMGGCTWTAEATSGRVGDNPYCHHRALELARIGKRERLELREMAEGNPFDLARFEVVFEDIPEAT
jgi:radical SAM protein with 4Fe4S-binding SPASM domain